MTCAVHPTASVAAYCRICGKALCEACERTVKGVVYCEDCIASRLHDTMPSAPAGTTAVVEPRSSTSPGLAAVLAAFFPFGVGQVYTGQYAKGLAHLLIFAFLVWGASDAGGGLEAVFGIGIAFFYVYQIIDAYRSAQALQRGEAPPDPFGLARTFSAGEKIDTAKVPTGAIILIGLGVLFLLSNMGMFHFFWFHRMWPLALIAIGVWMFLRRSGGPASPAGPAEGAR